VYNLKDGSKSAVFRQSILVVPPWKRRTS
jgi:hypothetical protein